MTSIFDYLSNFGTLVDCKSGQEGGLRDFKYRYLGLYFTATWCSYCVQIVNKLPQLIDKVNSKGEYLKFLTLRLDD
jgi:thiol-disulfide isomerase/thioredoxin